MSRVEKTWKNYNLEKTNQAETLILQQVVKDFSVIVANPLKQARQILSNVKNIILEATWPYNLAIKPDTDIITRNKSYIHFTHE